MSLRSASEPLWAALCASLMLHQSLVPSELVGGAASGVGMGSWPKKVGKMVGKLRFFHQGNGKIENFEAGEMERLPANCDLVNHKTANQKGQKKLPIVVSQPNHSGFLESLHFCCAVSNRFSGATPNPCLKELEKSWLWGILPMTHQAILRYWRTWTTNNIPNFGT